MYARSSATANHAISFFTAEQAADGLSHSASHPTPLQECLWCNTMAGWQSLQLPVVPSTNKLQQFPLHAGSTMPTTNISLTNQSQNEAVRLSLWSLQLCLHGEWMTSTTSVI